MSNMKLVPHPGDTLDVGTTSKPIRNIVTDSIEAGVVVGGDRNTRKKSTAYAVGDTILVPGLPVNMYLECTTSGQTGSSELVVTNPTAGTTINDSTAVWTVRQVLPTSGGIMAGSIDIAATNNDFYLGNSNNGGFLRINNKASARSGRIAMYAKDDSDISRLELMPDMQLKLYDTNSVKYDLGGSAIVAKSLTSQNGYVKYASGKIEQWGYAAYLGGTAAQTAKEVSLNISFASKNYVVFISNAQIYTDNAAKTVNINTVGSGNFNTSSFTVKNDLAIPTGNCGFFWFAVGY